MPNQFLYMFEIELFIVLFQTIHFSIRTQFEFKKKNFYFKQLSLA